MKERRRRLVVAIIVALVAVGSAGLSTLNQKQQSQAELQQPGPKVMASETTPASGTLAQSALGGLAVKGRAPKTGYTRTQFGSGWAPAGNCDMRNYILARDLDDVKTASDSDCTVVSGVLDDPYTAKTISFARGPGSSAKVQIDHVVALSDAWQKGAQALLAETRYQFANDPLNLLAVDGPANQQKGDGDAATWLPSNKAYRCRYVARQIAVKQKYTLWVTAAEREAMQRVLSQCPGQTLPVVGEADKAI
jgi:hypothetical protein